MKAMLQVQSTSNYAHLNGQAFPVLEIAGTATRTRVTLNIDGNKTDFKMKEVQLLGKYIFQNAN